MSVIRSDRLRAPIAAGLISALLCSSSGALGQAPVAPKEAPDINKQIAAVEARTANLTPFARLPACRSKPEEARWTHAGTPDHGKTRPLISAHRGGNTLAPENTLDAYEAALALGVDFVEVDVRETKDHRFVANHDDTVERTTDGTGAVADKTLAELEALNAADYAPWKGGPFDHTHIATLDEILALAKSAGAGLELDIKIGNRHAEIAALVAQYGETDKSIFNSQSPLTLQNAPGARLIYNRNSWEPPALLYKVAHASNVFGSKLAEFTPEAVVAIHDGCGFAMPHAYDQGADKEADQFRTARAMGAAGVQTNQPELIVGIAGLKVESVLRSRRDASGASQVCLVNARNGMGIYAKKLTLKRGPQTIGTVTTVQHGCASLDPALGVTRGVEVSFPGDPAIGPARLRLG